MQRAMRPLEDRLWNWNEVARREQARNRAEAAAVMPVLVQQVTENVIAQLDFVRIVRQIPVEDIVAQVDVEAIVARIDLGGVIRESTATVGAEAVDALRDQGMALDAFSARVVDRLLFRSGRARSSCASLREQARPRARALQGTRAGFVSRVVAGDHRRDVGRTSS